MCDTNCPLLSSLLFWIISLIPSKIFRNITLVVASACPTVYFIHLNRPSVRLDRLHNTITIVEDVLTRAKAKCMRDHLALAESETRLLRAKLSTSRLRSKLLEMHTMPWKFYLQNIRVIFRSLATCERELQDIQTAILLLIEAAHQFKLVADIDESSEIMNGLLHSQRSCMPLRTLSPSLGRLPGLNSTGGPGNLHQRFLRENFAQPLSRFWVFESTFGWHSVKFPAAKAELSFV
ncbi:hypothetical protein B0H19DRAFT_1073555 [Mycena capillaripes]|nr:hypothetical protein B0H19DRAFT_1073555 [Mycena capillaripes]